MHRMNGKLFPNLKVTYGVRLEIPFYFDKMQDNPAISALTFADGQKIDVGTWPKSAFWYLLVLDSTGM